VKRWIHEALSSVDEPITARKTLDIIKELNAKKDTARKSPNLSAVKLGTIMSRMPEINKKMGEKANSPLLYSLKEK
tara:strand:+ start:306 stop:533 length:228 start_codon:yes stop_codon:yes gene_type:complete